MQACDHPRGVSGPSCPSPGPFCPLPCLDLRVRVVNPLWSQGVRTVGDLVLALYRGEVRNLDPIALREIRAALVASGIVDDDNPGGGPTSPA